MPKAVPAAAHPASAVTVPVPVRGFVTDKKAFKAFIATHPTPDQFRTMYPDIWLILPADAAATPHEARTDNSRYFARLDSQGRIIGGKFR